MLKLDAKSEFIFTVQKMGMELLIQINILLLDMKLILRMNQFVIKKIM